MAAQVEIRESLGAQTLARVEFIAKYGVDRCQAERFCCVLGVRVCYVLLSLGIIDLHRQSFFVSFKFLSTAGAARVSHPVSKYSS